MHLIAFLNVQSGSDFPEYLGITNSVKVETNVRAECQNFHRNESPEQISNSSVYCDFMNFGLEDQIRKISSSRSYILMSTNSCICVQVHTKLCLSLLHTHIYIFIFIARLYGWSSNIFRITSLYYNVSKE